MIDLVDLLNIVFFIVPGYFVLYFVSLITDYLYEKNQLDRIIQYLFFSFVCYITSSFIVFLSFLISCLFKIIKFDDIFSWISFLQNHMIILTLLAIIIAPFLGFSLGLNYFGNGYPHKHFSKYTTKKYTQSIYADFFLKQYKKGPWITCHMKDGTIIQGKLSDYDKDEEGLCYWFN